MILHHQDGHQPTSTDALRATAVAVDKIFRRVSHLAEAPDHVDASRLQSAIGKRVRAPVPKKGSRWPSLMTTLRRVGMLWFAGGFGTPAPLGNCLRVPERLSQYPAGTPQRSASVEPPPVLEIALVSAHVARGTGRSLLRQREERPARTPITHEIVVSRPGQEEIAWIFKIPDTWRVTVYSNLPAETARLWPDDLSPQVPWEFIVWPHHAFGEAFAHHLASRYSSLAGYTVLSPAFPLEQSPSLLDMMAHPVLLASTQAMSLRVNAHFPPLFVQENERPDAWYRSERFSLRTLEPTDFTDLHVSKAASAYREKFGLAEDANLLAHLFSKIGVDDHWLDEDAEVGTFAYGGIVGFTRSNAHKHEPEVYKQLEKIAGLPDPFTMLVERSWLMLMAPGGYREGRPEIWRGSIRSEAVERQKA